MTYDPGIPNASNSPSIFPAQSQANFGRLETIVGADHQFNLTAASNDGYHNLIRMNPPNPDPSGALTGIGRLYSKDVSGTQQLHFMADDGTEYQITPSLAGAGIVAAVNFNGVGGASIRSSLNVSSVTRTSLGRYTVNFTNPIVNTNYIVSITGMRNQNSSAGVVPSSGYVLGNPTYGNSVSTNSIKIGFSGLTTSAVDVIMANLIVYSV